MEEQTPSAKLRAALKALRSAKRDKDDSSCASCFGIAFSIVPLLIGLGFISTESATGWAVGILFVFGALVLLLKCAGRLSDRPKSYAEAIGQLHAAVAALSGEESATADDYDRDNLYELYKSAPPELAITILRALSVVGDRDTLRFVKDVLSNNYTRYWSPSSMQPAVRNQAVETARRIETRLELSRKSTTLLRASPAPETSDLLRPAGSQAESHEHLLRVEAEE